MPRLTLNLKEAQKREPLPDDTYHCRVNEVSEPVQGAKAAYVTVKFGVAEGEHEGREIWDNVMISGKAAGQFADLWQLLTGEELPYGEEGIDVDTDEILGKELAIVTVQEEYPEGSGKFNHKAKRYLPL